MSERNCRVRFLENNYAELITQSIEVSSELSSFPLSNAINPFRSRVFKFSGNFTITTSNQKLYINDGSDKEITLDTGNYTTPDLLATEIQSKLNASSSNWTVSYSTTTSSFTISNTGSVTLRYSQQTNAIWDDIGFTETTDTTGTSFVAVAQRNHNEEYMIFDLGWNPEITAFAVISPLDEVFTISESATIKLQAGNLNQWDSPPLDITLSRTDQGIFLFLDDLTDTSYRFWRFYIQDRENFLGSTGISISNVYIGDYITFDSNNIGNGLNFSVVDPSEVVESESGVLHFDEKTNYSQIENLNINLMRKEAKDKFVDVFRKTGTTTPFYLSIDPLETISSDIFDFTKYCVFDSPPVYSHIITDLFNVSFAVREVI